MTQLSQKMVDCPNCGVKNRMIYYASINTFLDFDGNLISKLLDGTLNTSTCKNCGVNIRLAMDILISSPKAMFYLNPADNLEVKKKKLEEYGILSKKGIIISGLASQYAEAKNKLEEKNQYKPSPLPPPAPKVTSNTKNYNKLREELNRILLKNEKDEEDKNSNPDTEQPKPPPPPPPPPN